MQNRMKAVRIIDDVDIVASVQQVFGGAGLRCYASNVLAS